MKYNGCEQRKAYTMHNVLGFSVISFVSSFHPMFYPPLILSCHYFIFFFFGKTAFWLHTKTRLRFVWADLVEAVLFLVGFY